MIVFGRIVAVLALVLSVVCYGCAFPPVGFYPLAWLAPLVWLFYLPGWSVGRIFVVMFGVGYVGALLVVGWLGELFGGLAWLLWCVPGLYFGLWGASTVLFRGRGWQRIVWPPVAWVAVEYFRCELGPLAFPFGALGYSQANWMGFSIGEVGGVYGVSFCMVLAGALASEVWRNRGDYPVALRFGTLGYMPILVLSALIPMFMFRGDHMRVGTALLQQQRQDYDIGADGGLPRELPAADLVVWPEMIFMDEPRLEENVWLRNIMRGEARQSAWGVIFGGMDYLTDGIGGGGNDFYNSAFNMTGEGVIAGVAGKNQPVHLMRDGRAAADVSLIRMDAGEYRRVVAGVGVCYDGCFQKYSRRMAARGADFLVFPVLNLEAWGAAQHRQHQHMFQMRAAETGRSVLVAAISGPTMGVAPGGALTTEVAPFNTTVLLEAPILAPKGTVFMRVGWLFAPMMLGVFVAGLGWTVWLEGRNWVRRMRREKLLGEGDVEYEE